MWDRAVLLSDRMGAWSDWNSSSGNGGEYLNRGPGASSHLGLVEIVCWLRYSFLAWTALRISLILPKLSRLLVGIFLRLKIHPATKIQYIINIKPIHSAKM
jgi:hypothetical protein